MSKKKIYILVALFLSFMFFLAVASMWNDSATNDEVAHIPAGYSYLKTADYRLNPEHPPLIKDLCALPLLFMNLKASFDHRSWQEHDQWAFGQQFLYHWGNDADKIARAARLPVIILMIMLGIYIFQWARKIWGNKAALLALFFYCFSPTVIAHGRLVTTDLGIALFFFITLYYFWLFLKNPSFKLLIITGIVFGLAQLTKFSAVLLVPLMLLVILLYGFCFNKKINLKIWGAERIKGFKKRNIYILLISLFLIFFIGFGLVWLVYLIQTARMPVDVQQDLILHSLDDNATRALIYRLASVPVIRSFDHFLLGAAMASGHTIAGHTSYLLGQLANGWWYYFPVVFVLKETIPVLFFTLLGIVFVGFTLYRLIKNLIKKPRKIKIQLSKFFLHYFEEIFLLLPILTFFAAGMYGRLNLGIRYLLPTFPFLFLLFAGIFYKFDLALLKLEIKRRVFAGTYTFIYYLLILFILAWQLAAATGIFPHYLAYFNPLFGGPEKGYHYVTDSNLDWGQDLKRLKFYLDQKGIQNINLSYFGHAEPPYYKISYRNFGIDSQDIRGLTAISATNLQQTRGKDNGFGFWWLREKQPIDQVGYSILIYDLK